MTEKQFREMVHRYERLVYTICFQFTLDRQIAEDLTQETFLSAYTHRDSCREETAKPWFARIAANKAKDYLKSAYHNRVTLAQTGEEELEPQSGIRPSPGTEQPEDLYIAREQVEAIRQCIYEMREPYRLVSIGYFLEEKSVQELAMQLGRPYKTVHTQLYRAKNMLQEKLREGGMGCDEF